MILVLGTGVVYGASPQIKDNNSIFQLSTLNSLSAGNFDGNWTIGELRSHGDT